jgi:hypothetical protein
MLQIGENMLHVHGNGCNLLANVFFKFVDGMRLVLVDLFPQQVQQENTWCG